MGFVGGRDSFHGRPTDWNGDQRSRLLEVNHHTDTEDVVVAIRSSAACESGIVGDLPGDVVELHPCIRVEQPVQAQSQ